MFYELAIIFRRTKPALNRVLKYDRMTRLPSTAPADLGDPKRGRPHTRYKLIRAFITMCRDERISFADPLLPPDLRCACFATAHLGRNLRFARLSKKPRPDFVGTVLSFHSRRRTSSPRSWKYKTRSFRCGLLVGRLGRTNFEPVFSGYRGDRYAASRIKLNHI
jgi:hypothetical protein